MAGVDLPASRCRGGPASVDALIMAGVYLVQIDHGRALVVKMPGCRGGPASVDALNWFHGRPFLRALWLITKISVTKVVH